MKKVTVSILLAAMLLSLAACGTSSQTTETPAQETSAGVEAGAEAGDTASQTAGLGALTSTEDVTAEYLTKATSAAELLKSMDIFSVSNLYENTGDELLEGTQVSSTFAKRGQYMDVNNQSVYGDGYKSNEFFSTDPADTNYYMTSDAGNDMAEMDAGYADDFSTSSVRGYTSENLFISQVTEENGMYVATAEVKENGERISTETITIDPTTGLVTKVVSTYPSAKGSGDATCTSTFDYSADQTIDYSAITANGGQILEAADQNQAAGQTDGQASGAFNLNNVEDINGNPVSQDVIKDAKLVMLNFWEPWCGPCVKEMPDLQALYEKYKDQGLVILGVYSAFEEQENAESIVESKGITYPILKCNDDLKKLQQSYFPASYFIDGQGNLLTEEPVIGAQTYEKWEEYIQSYLGE